MVKNREKWDRSVRERTEKNKSALLEQLKKLPILQVALERSALSRSTYYHWRDTDSEFKKNASQAIAEGEAFITDMSESQLVSLIKDKHFPAVQLWLRQHHSKYAETVEFSGSLTLQDESLTPEQEELIAQALKLAGVTNAKTPPDQHDKNTT